MGHVESAMHQKSQIVNKLTRRPQQYPSEQITGPKDAMKNELVPELPLSGGYHDIVTTTDVFSRYMFAYPTTNQLVGSIIFNTMTKHAYLPTTVTSDKGSTFLSQVIKEVTGVFGITLQHATTKHERLIGMVEGTHASLKRAFK